MIRLGTANKGEILGTAVHHDSSISDFRNIILNILACWKLLQYQCILRCDTNIPEEPAASTINSTVKTDAGPTIYLFLSSHMGI